MATAPRINPFASPESFAELVGEYRARTINRTELGQQLTQHLSRFYVVTALVEQYRSDIVPYGRLQQAMLEWQMDLDQQLKANGIGPMMENFPTESDPDASRSSELRNLFARVVVHDAVRRAMTRAQGKEEDAGISPAPSGYAR